MKNIFKVAVFFAIFFFGFPSLIHFDHSFQPPRPRTETDERSLPGSKAPVLSPDFGHLPLYFIPNRGQVDQEALFYAATPGYTLWITKKSFVFDCPKRLKRNDFQDPAARLDQTSTEDTFGDMDSFSKQARPGSTSALEREASSLVFRGANPEVMVIPLYPSAFRVNYLIGNEPKKWKRRIPTSTAVVYRRIYDEIDLKVYGVEGRIEYDWVIKPSGDPEKIRFDFTGVQETGLDPKGDLIVTTPSGILTHRKPSAYQVIHGKKIDVEARYRELAGRFYGFEVGDYDRGRELVIDPVVLIFSTYLGGSQYDKCEGIAVDSAKNVYVTGFTTSTDFPVQNAYQAIGINTEAFLTKFAPDGQSLIYSTFFGGSSNDFGHDLGIDENGLAYIVGETRSSNLPIKNAFQNAYGGGNFYGDAFVTKFTGDGSDLVFSTYLGGWGWEEGLGIFVEQAGACYATGWTNSSNFMMNNAFQGTYGGGSYYGDAFVVKFQPDGTNVFSTFLGGSGDEIGYGISSDSSACAYVTGLTKSTNFPKQNPFQSSLMSTQDVFISKFASNGASLVYSTYLGGASIETGMGIVVDSSNAAYVCGRTSSADFPTQNPYRDVMIGSGEAFITKISPAGTSLEYSSFLGGKDQDFANDIVLDGSLQAYVSGSTVSSDFPTLDSYQTYQGGYDSFVTGFSSTGNSLIFSTLVGGISTDYGNAVAIDGDGSVYLAGETSSTDFPLKNAYQNSLKSAPDGFVVKLVHGSVKEDLVGTWDGQGVYYRDSAAGTWSPLASPAEMIACGDLYGDGTDDLIGIWPSQAGVWTRNSADGQWAFLSSTARHIAAGDMNGDGRKDFLGAWDGQGVFYRDSISGNWTLLATPATMITAGDLDGDDKADLIGIWPTQAGVWVKFTETGNWAYLGSSARDMTTGDMDGDGRADLVGTWDGQGVFYRNSISGQWIQIASPADQITAGDLDGDGIDDLIGIWAGQAGVWVKFSQTVSWNYIGSSARDIAAGMLAGGSWSSGLGRFAAISPPMGGYHQGPSNAIFSDLSAFGPRGSRFVFKSESNLTPPDRQTITTAHRLPGPGEPGFQSIQQKNLFPSKR